MIKLQSYPADPQFEEVKISKVEKEGKGWSIERSDGWSFFIPAESPIEPKRGMSARFYGNGIGAEVRGLFLAGVKVFYRTEEEQREHHAINTYGADATDWLARWDAGRSVFSIEMGGLGPGYEQAIQMTVAEVLRIMLAARFDASRWSDGKSWPMDRKTIEAAGFKNATIEKLGLSGAQWGAALSLASALYQRGPRAILADEKVKDRSIQVSKSFPSV